MGITGPLTFRRGPWTAGQSVDGAGLPPPRVHRTDGPRADSPCPARIVHTPVPRVASLGALAGMKSCAQLAQGGLEALILTAQLCDLLVGVQHRGVVLASESLADRGQG